MTTASSTQPPRDRALDGLRGIAAIAVVLSHFVVATVAVLSSRFFDTPPQPVTGLAWLASETPLAVVWAGREWVIVFFVLSGLVLSLAAAGGARFDAARYYPTRLVRLYLPVWACLVFAALVHELVAHERVAGATQWLNLHAVEWSPATTAKEMLLVFGAGDNYYTTVLWTCAGRCSIRSRCRCSCIVARRFPLSLLAGSSLLVVLVGGVEFELLRFIAAFMIGTTMAFGREQITRVLARGDAYAATLVASPILLSATYWMPAGRWHGTAIAMVTIGAAGMVAIAMVPGPFARVDAHAADAARRQALVQPVPRPRADRRRDGVRARRPAVAARPGRVRRAADRGRDGAVLPLRRAAGAHARPQPRPIDGASACTARRAPHPRPKAQA